MNQSPAEANQLNMPNEILAKAVSRVRSALGLSQRQLLSILKAQTLDGLDSSSETGKRAAQLIWIYQRLYAYVGGDKKAMHHWVSTHNRSLGSSPVDVMSTDSGLDQVIDYLNSRGA